MRVALFERIVHRQGVQEHRVGIEPPPGFAARNDRYVGFEIFPGEHFPFHRVEKAFRIAVGRFQFAGYQEAGIVVVREQLVRWRRLF